MNTLLKKYRFSAAFIIALAETIILFYFYSDKTNNSIWALIASYAILAFFPLKTFLASMKVFRTQQSISLLKEQEQTALHQKDIVTFSHHKLHIQAKAFSKKLEKVQHLLEKNKIEDAQNILGITSSDITTASKQLYCNDTILNLILHNKKLECEEKGILFHHSILFPEDNTFSFSVIISLFSNLLDNAIEGCENSKKRTPEIELLVDYKGDFLVIFVRNTKDSSIHFENKTTKTDSISHGFGLSIIEELARQRDGFCEWQDLGSYFESHVMLRYF